MTNEVISDKVKKGHRLNINNPFSVPVKAIISGLNCGTVIEIGLSAGQFFTVVGGDSNVTVVFQDMAATQLQHPGPVIGQAIPNDMH